MVTVNKYVILFPVSWYDTCLWKSSVVTCFLWLIVRSLKFSYARNFTLQYPHLCNSWLVSIAGCFAVVMNIQPYKNMHIWRNKCKLSVMFHTSQLLILSASKVGPSGQQKTCWDSVCKTEPPPDTHAATLKTCWRAKGNAPDTKPRSYCLPSQGFKTVTVQTI